MGDSNDTQPIQYITPGRLTSEHAMAVAANLRSDIVSLCGLITTIGGGLLPLWLPLLGSHSKIIMAAGAVVTSAGIVSRALTSGAYSASRGATKSAGGTALTSAPDSPVEPASMKN